MLNGPTETLLPSSALGETKAEECILVEMVILRLDQQYWP